jgi:hypothetical protein
MLIKDRNNFSSIGNCVISFNSADCQFRYILHIFPRVYDLNLEINERLTEFRHCSMIVHGIIGVGTFLQCAYENKVKDRSTL